MSRPGMLARRGREFIMAMVIALTSCRQDSSASKIADPQDAAQIVMAQRDASPRDAFPADASPPDAAQTATARRDAALSAAQKWRAEVARRLKHMARPFFVKRRGAGYRKPTTKRCLEREAGLLEHIDPLNMIGLDFNWDVVFIVYRHKGTVDDARRAAIKLAKALGGCVYEYANTLEGTLVVKRRTVETRRHYEKAHKTGPGVFLVRNKGKREIWQKIKQRPRLKKRLGFSVRLLRMHEGVRRLWRIIHLLRPLKEWRRIWRKEISSYDKTIRDIKYTPCMEGYYQVRLPYRDRKKCEVAARVAAKDRRVRYAFCYGISFLRHRDTSLPCPK